MIKQKNKKIEKFAGNIASVIDFVIKSDITFLVFF